MSGHFGLTVTRADGAVHKPEPLGGQFGELHVSGIITAASSNDTWVVDSCAPGTGCSPSLSTFELKGDGTKLTSPPGTLVDVKFEMNNLGGITMDRLLMTNLSVGQGLSNPTRGGAGLWLDMNLHRDSPFVWLKRPIPGCVVYNADSAAGYEESPGYEHTWIRWAP